ncbi:hypothetical protein LCGC14_0717870 [marine sediment metagenome]|uniref:Phage portal protein n=1 Tax=marine sediment metagenome TaxID=412755 RepID=A0A0F9TKQ3_9ZZZZ
MTTGVLTHAKNFLVGNWKAPDNIIMGNVPTKGLAFNGEVLVPGNPQAALKAFKGIVYTCVDLRAIAVSMTIRRVYKVKDSRAKSFYKKTRVKELSNQRQDEIISKAAPGSRLSMAEGVEEILNGPFVELLRRPNNYLSASALNKLSSQYLDLLGNSYYIIVRNKIVNPATGLRMPVNLWVAPAEYMKPIAGDNVLIAGYEYKRGMKKIIYPPEDVIHFKYPTPLNQFVGMAPLAAILDTVMFREYMLNFEAQMFKTGGNPKIILMTKGQMNKAQSDMAKESYKNTEEAGIAVMGGQDFDFFQPATITARDMGYREGIAFTKDDIAMAFHVPEVMLGGGESNLAVATTLAMRFYLAEYATKPTVMMKDEEINEQLAWQFNEDTFVLTDDPVPENKEEARAERKLNLELGLTTREEERMLLNLPEDVEGLLVPSDLVPIEQAGQVKEADDDAIVAQLQRVMVKYKEQGGVMIRREALITAVEEGLGA